MTEETTALDRAFDLHRRGKFAEARSAAEAALPHSPENASLLRLLGDSCCRTGDLAEGIVYLRKAHELAPDDLQIRIDLANAFAAAGDLPAAEALCEVDVNSSPDLARLRGYILQTQGRHAEAIDVYRRIIDKNPEDWESWNNLGNALRMVRDFDGAADALGHAASLAPYSAVIRLNLAGVQAVLGRLDESLRSTEQAVRIDPANPIVLLQNSRALARLGRDEEAAVSLEKAIGFAPNEPQLQVELGLVYGTLRRLEDAEGAYRAALRQQPRFGPAFLHLGMLLESQNRVDELSSLLNEADRQSVPEEETALLRALAYRREGRFDEALAAADAASGKIEPVRRAQLIGEVADRLGQEDRAFAAFKEMNRLVASKPPYPREAGARYRQAMESVADLTTSDWYGGWTSADPDKQRPAPVFLVGFPRSGTTLLDTILMGHSDLVVLEERPIIQRLGERLGGPEKLSDLQKEDVDRLRAHYFAELDAIEPNATGKVVIDKLPLSIMQSALIHRVFPDARFIFAERHPCDVVLSCFMTNFKLNAAMANFLDLEDAADLYRIVLGYWEQAKSVFGLDVHSIRYEAMVEDLAGELRPLMAFLGLPWEDRLLDYQRTAADRGYISSPSYSQVTERIYGRATGRWERYRRHMDIVLPVLAPWAERMGYQVDVSPGAGRTFA